LAGSEWRFDDKKLKSLYGTTANYRRVAGKALQAQLDQGLLLREDAEVLRRETIEPIIIQDV
jgi:hypothetical protein